MVMSLFSFAEVILAAINPARRVHCGKHRSSVSSIAVLLLLAFAAVLSLVMDSMKRSCEESPKVNGPPSRLLLSLRGQV